MVAEEEDVQDLLWSILLRRSLRVWSGYKSKYMYAIYLVNIFSLTLTCWELGNGPCMNVFFVILAWVMDLTCHGTDAKLIFFFRIPSGHRHRESYDWQQLNRNPCSPYLDGNRNTNSRFLSQSTMSLTDKKMKVCLLRFHSKNVWDK